MKEKRPTNHSGENPLQDRPTRPVRVAAIGGGTGLSTLLRGIGRGRAGTTSRFEVTAIVAVTDDGRSSGRVRAEFGVLPPGDIRNCLVALAAAGDPLTALFDHRFPGEGGLGGHALGNLMLLALSQMEGGDFLAGIEAARSLLGVEARVLPSTLSPVELHARIGEQWVIGQIAIKSHQGPIKDLGLLPPNAEPLPAALEAIRTADLITLGPGSLFTSVITNLVVPGIAEAIAASPARKIYICNAMTEQDETDGMSATDHVRTLLGYLQGGRIDDALFNCAPISSSMRDRYAAERAVAIPPPEEVPTDLRDLRFHRLPLASEEGFVRHDPDRLREALLEICSDQTEQTI
ncbi:MAG: gluconeogenesis factor YvcK family protein [Blastocatellia bacterium]